MSVVRYDPFREMFTLSDHLNRLLTHAPRREDLNAVAFPAVDIREDPEGIHLSADLPGVDPEAIDLKLENQTLTLSGERKLAHADKRDQYQRVESWAGTFNRTFALPPTVDVEKVKAQHKNGVLTVFLPRREETKPRQVKVKIDA
jgi:HSP20 family protein